MIHYEAEPLRRSKREKRLVFATLNVRQIDKQILNPGPAYQDMDLSEVSVISLCLLPWRCSVWPLSKRYVYEQAGCAIMHSVKDMKKAATTVNRCYS